MPQRWGRRKCTRCDASMLRLIGLFLVLAMLVQVIRPFGYPGLRLIDAEPIGAYRHVRPAAT